MFIKKELSNTPIKDFEKKVFVFPMPKNNPESGNKPNN
jgi:hypothetical protein